MLRSQDLCWGARRRLPRGTQGERTAAALAARSPEARSFARFFWVRRRRIQDRRQLDVNGLVYQKLASKFRAAYPLACEARDRAGSVAVSVRLRGLSAPRAARTCWRTFASRAPAAPRPGPHRLSRSAWSSASSGCERLFSPPRERRSNLLEPQQKTFVGGPNRVLNVRDRSEGLLES